MATSIINTKLGENRSVARVWLEGQKLSRGGVNVGARYALHMQEGFQRFELRPVPENYVGETFTVSRREKNGIVFPLFEIRSETFRKLFEVSAKLRVIIRDARIIITRSQIDIKIAERVKRFMEKLKNGQKLATVSLFHGGSTSPFIAAYKKPVWVLLSRLALNWKMHIWSLHSGITKNFGARNRLQFVATLRRSICKVETSRRRISWWPESHAQGLQSQVALRTKPVVLRNTLLLVLCSSMCWIGSRLVILQ